MDNSFSTPPVIAPMSPRPPSRGRGWMALAVILIVLLCLSVFVNFTQMVSHSLHLGTLQNTNEHQAGPQVEEAILKDNGSENKIAVIPVDGIITGHAADDSGNDMVEVFKAELDAAKNDKDVKAVILKVDSPGGEVMAADDMYRAIRRFEDDTNGKPVICSMGSLAASGGYYISAPCRWIVADELTLTGSIGVIMETVNYRGLMDKIGVSPYVFKSGTYKDMLSGSRETNEIPPGEHEMVQGLVTDTYNRFKSVVQEGRDAAHEKNKEDGQPLSPDWTNFADGRVLSGEQALHLGLVDQLGDFRDAVDRAKKIAGISDANLVEYQESYDISQFLKFLGKSEIKNRDVKVDLGMDVPRVEAGQFYYLYLPTAD
jgi:protease-4